MNKTPDRRSGRYVTHAAGDGIEVFSYVGPAWHLARHAHEDFQLTLYSGPPHRFEVAGREAIGSPRSAVVIQSGEPHSSRPGSDDAIHLRGLYVSPAAFEAVASSLWQGRGSVCFRESVIDAPSAIAELERAHRSFEGGDLGGHESLTVALGEILRRLATPFGAERPVDAEHAGITRVRDFLHAHLADEVTLDQLARIAGLSRYHVIRSFRRRFGTTPFAYQRTLRLHRAREVLAHGGAIRDAVAAGRYADPSHLGRAFFSCYGVTPGRYLSSFAPARASTRV